MNSKHKSTDSVTRRNCCESKTRRNQEALRADLTSETETLEATKIDRLTLSEALITLGMKLKEDSLFDQFAADLGLDEDLDTNAEES